MSLITDLPDSYDDRPSIQLPRYSAKVRKEMNRLLDEEEAQKKRTWSYYQDIKRSDKDKWLSPEIQRQMQQDAIDLGDAFVDGDFDR